VQNIKQLLTAVPALNLAAVSDQSGNVTDSAGQGETEVLSAVATLSLRHLDELSELLGLGPLQAWCFGTERAALYVVNRNGRLYAATGESGKNVETTLKNMIQAVEAP
jgi:hypothetical protein